VGRHQPLHVDLADEVVEHHLDGVEVGDDAVLERADGDDALRGLADHRLRLGADAEGPAGPVSMATTLGSEMTMPLPRT
jgi:hypothetical protein